MECPFIDKSIPSPDFNEPAVYVTSDGAKYVFYRHDDGYGLKRNVQFCQCRGRKVDIFECLNENEWKRCFFYQMHEKELDERSTAYN